MNLKGFAQITPALRRLDVEHPIALHLVTDLTYGRVLGRFLQRGTDRVARRIFARSHLYAWNPATFSAILSACDIGVIPMALDDELARHKPENKLLLLWRHGLPVVTSETPAYTRTMEEAGMQLTCSDSDHWESTLRELILDEAARRRAGQAGMRFSEQQRGEAEMLARWDDLFASLGLDLTRPEGVGKDATGSTKSQPRRAGAP